jgi:hypothetical protein
MAFAVATWAFLVIEFRLESREVSLDIELLDMIFSLNLF